MAIRHGADAIGLVGVSPPTPRTVSDAVAAEIVAATPPPVAAFLLTAEEEGEAIARHVHRVGAAVVQIVKHIEPREYIRLSERFPKGGVRRVQVVHVEGSGALDLIERYTQFVDAFLLDSGAPSSPTPDYGGTGRTHDWNVSAEFVRRSTLPVFLAGGLTPDNVAQAIEMVRPYAVDLCNGVRSQNILDERKLKAFLRAVADVDAELGRKQDARP